MAGKAAVDRDTEKALLDAEIFVAVLAIAALAAADPGEHRLLFSDQLFWGVRADFLDDACDLMAERERQRHAARGVEPLAAAEIGIAVLDVEVGMAQPATFDADEHFSALRLRCVDDGFAQRRIEFDQGLAAHQRHEVVSFDVTGARAVAI